MIATEHRSCTSTRKESLNSANFVAEDMNETSENAQHIRQSVISVTSKIISHECAEISRSRRQQDAYMQSRIGNPTATTSWHIELKKLTRRAAKRNGFVSLNVSLPGKKFTPLRCQLDSGSTCNTVSYKDYCNLFEGRR